MKFKSSKRENMAVNPPKTSKTKLNINIQTFDGSHDQVAWFCEQVQDYKHLFNLTDKEAIVLLKSKLTGNAISWYLSNPNIKDCENLVTILDKMTDFFSNEVSPNNSLIALQNMHLLPGESIKSLAHRITVATSKTYKVQPEALNQIVSLQLVSALPIEIKSKIIEENLTDLSDIINRATHLKNVKDNLKILHAHSLTVSKPLIDPAINACETLEQKVKTLAEEVKLLSINNSPKCSFCSSADHNMQNCTQFINSLKGITNESQAVNFVDYKKKSFSKEEKIVKCYFCNKRGHIKRDCYAYQASLKSKYAYQQNYAPNHPMPMRHPHNFDYRANYDRNNYQMNQQGANNLFPQNLSARPFFPPQSSQIQFTAPHMPVLPTAPESQSLQYQHQLN